MWLGSYNTKKFKNYYHRSNLRLLKNIKIRNGGYNLFRCLTPHSYVFYAPNNWKLSVLKRGFKCFYFVTDVYFFSFSIPANLFNFKINRQISSITFYSQLNLPDTKGTVLLLNSIVNSFSQLFFIKLRFKGKGYYLYKNSRNTITPQFGYAHRIYKYNYMTVVKFLSKTKVFFFGLSKNDLFKLTASLKSIRPVNIFTGRGVRFSKSIVYKKTGKVSSYR